MLDNILELDFYKGDYKTMFYALASTTMTMFAVIDIFGNMPLFLDLRKKHGSINSKKAVFIATCILVGFLFLGEYILNIIGLNLESFSVAGAIIFFLFAFELILGIELFKYNVEESKSIAVVPVAFPLLAGPGSFTMLLSLKADNSYLIILLALAINLSLVFFVLKKTEYISNLLGSAGIGIIRRVFGIVLLAMAVKMFATNVKHMFKEDNNFRVNHYEKKV